jgi:hypothetical protein
MKSDKIKHCVVSFGLTIIFSLSLSSLLLGMLITLSIGIVKELYDEYRYFELNDGVGFDRYDVLADMVGILFGAFICIVCNVLF